MVTAKTKLEDSVEKGLDTHVANDVATCPLLQARDS